jgi:hypothetical protein
VVCMYQARYQNKKKMINGAHTSSSTLICHGVVPIPLLRLQEEVGYCELPSWLRWDLDAPSLDALTALYMPVIWATHSVGMTHESGVGV